MWGATKRSFCTIPRGVLRSAESAPEVAAEFGDQFVPVLWIVGAPTSHSRRGRHRQVVEVRHVWGFHIRRGPALLFQPFHSGVVCDVGDYLGAAAWIDP